MTFWRNIESGVCFTRRDDDPPSGDYIEQIPKEHYIRLLKAYGASEEEIAYYENSGGQECEK